MYSRVTSKLDLINRILSNESKIKSFGVIRIGIFGSFVKDQISSDSDVDFLVEFDQAKKSFDNFMDLAFFLQEITGRKIELVTPQSLSRYIGPYILKEVEYVPLAA